jgi:hypothetical protein
VQAMRERDAQRAAFLIGRHIRKARSNLLRLEGITSLIMSEAEMEDQAKAEPRARKKAPRPG